MRVEGIATQDVTLSETTRARAVRKLEERIVKKSLDIIILKEVKEKPLGGYDVILLIRRRFGVKLSPGTVYSLLRSLDRKGLVKGNGEKPKVYILTEEGEKILRIIMAMQSNIKALNRSIF